MKVETNPEVKKILGGDLVLSIPFLSGLSTPTSLLTWLVAVLALLPWVVWVVCIFVILLNAIKWVRSSGNEKELESAKTGIKRALIGFLSMFFLFMIANFMSYVFIGTSFDRLVGALAPCQAVSKDTYVFEFARKNNMDYDRAFEVCRPQDTPRNKANNSGI